MSWKWLETDTAKTWGFFGRVIIKGLLLFALCNVIFAVMRPLELIASYSVYGWLVPYRTRLPYGEKPERAYNVSVDSVPMMFATHEIRRPKAADEWRVLVLGDSGVWGWYLPADETLVHTLNSLNLSHDGKRLVFYNLAYPVSSLVKDLLILDEALHYQPDTVLWLVSLTGNQSDRRYEVPLIQNNVERIERLVQDYGLNVNPQDERFVRLNWRGQLLLNRRADIANWLRLQSYGITWAATRLDQDIPTNFELLMTNYEADYLWYTYPNEAVLSSNDFSFDVLETGFARVGEVELIVINEPIYISTGQNSAIRYNSFYPRWAYDQYRQAFADFAESRSWRYLDLWDAVPAEDFTNTPLHYSAAGALALAETIARQLAWR